ncbi:MAG: hypothetical protein AB7K52_08020 [Phycisphaerales bacterium]
MPMSALMRVRTSLRAGALLALAAVSVVASVAAGDEFQDRVNAPFKQYAQDRRSDTILLPLLAKLTDPPSAASPALQAALLPSEAAAFAGASEWSQSESSAAFFEGLKKVTGEKDWKRAFGFAQPYGVGGVEPEIIAARAYTDLGDPPLLGRAKHLYLPMLDRAECLVHVEATRLQSAGQPDKALELLWRWAHFSRSMCDRAFFAEVTWGLKATTLAIERMRDVAYVDSRLEKPLLTAEYIVREVITDRLKDRSGILEVDRITFPEGNRIAAEQLIATVFKRRGDADTAIYAKILGEVTAKGRAMRLFSETARWDSLSKLAGNQLETSEKLGHVQGDWVLRWKLPPLDPLHRLRSDFQKMDKVRFAIIQLIVGDMGPLFEQRHRLQIELNGTRMALAMQAYYLGQQNYPRTLGSVAPAYAPKLDPDPFSAAKPPRDFWFFVPVRDAVRDPINPVTKHDVTVFPANNFPSFTKSLDASHFVIYSVGPDGAQQGCSRATQMVEDDKGDYLIWPPVMSLVRENLVTTGALK